MVLLSLQRSGFYSDTSGKCRRAELDINKTEIKQYTRCGGLFDSAYICGSYICTRKTVNLFCHCTKSSQAFFWLVYRTVWNCLQLLKVDVNGESAF